MVNIRPLTAIHYARNPKLELSKLIAPPYDVLDERGKAALVARHPHNIVNIDLPHLPPKTVGPDAVYVKANVTLEAWLNSACLIRNPRPALFRYMRGYENKGRFFNRGEFFCVVRLPAFSKGLAFRPAKT